MSLITNITEETTWTPYVYLIEVNDLVEGYDYETGELGLSNQQASDLANRTQYLRTLFEQGHSTEGLHAIDNAQVDTSASVVESKLSLDHSTASLHSSLDNLNSLLAETDSLVDVVRNASLDLFEAVGKAIPLSWLYSNKYFDFELFLPTRQLTLMDMDPVDILATVSGDESIDVADTSELVAGRSYVVYTEDGSTSYKITVMEVLSPTRFRCTEEFPATMASGKLSCTSWSIPETGSYATAKNNSMFITRPIIGLGDYEYGRIVLRCTNTTGEITVQSKLVAGSIWSDCELIETVSREQGYTDYEFKCPGGNVELAFKISTGSLATSVTVRNICVMPISNYVLSDDVRQPSNVTPAEGTPNTGETPTLTGSTYYSLYGLPQDGAQFQVSTDAGFFNLAVNATTSGVGVSHVVGAGALSPSVAYYWRCRYKDSAGVWSKWSAATQFVTSAQFLSVATPVNASPSSGQQNIGVVGSYLVSSAFRLVGAGADTHASSRWQVATDAAFTSIVHDSNETTTQKTSYLIPDGVMSLSTYYYWRVQHKGTALGWSQWSTGTRYLTTSISSVVTAPACVSPVSGTTGVPPASTTLRSTNFIVANGSDTHEMSQWQVYNSANFEADPSGTLVFGSGYTAVNLTSCPVPEGSLSNNTQYWWRVRHKGATLGWSAWSAVATFTTMAAVGVATPTNVSPANDAVNVNTAGVVLSASAFTPINAPAEVHKHSEWQISTSVSFASENIIYQSGANATDLTSHTLATLTLNADTTYYWRVRYTGFTAGTSSWSIATSFKTALAASIATPAIIAPTNGASGVDFTNITFTSSAFSVTNVVSTHEASQWQVASDAGFLTVVWDSGSTSAATAKTVAFTTLQPSTTYHWRVRYKGTTIGWSAWSATASFTTTAAKVITTPTVVSPANNAANFPKYGAIATSSPFIYTGSTATHTASRWIVATFNAGTNTYTTLHTATVTGANLLSAALPESVLSFGGTYHLKVQYQASDGVWSQYSAWSAFTVVAATRYIRNFVSNYDTAILGLCADPDGNTYVLERAQYTPASASPKKYHSIIHKFSRENTLLWKKVFNDTGLFHIIYSSATNSVYVAGKAYRGYEDSARPALLKIDKTTGDVQWSKYMEYTKSGVTLGSGQFDVVYELPNGNVVASGLADGTRSLIVCFNSSGAVAWSFSVHEYDAFNSISYGAGVLAFTGTKKTDLSKSDGTVYLTGINGPSALDLGQLYKFTYSDEHVQFLSSWCNPANGDIYIGGRIDRRSIFGKFSNTTKNIEFLKWVTDGTKPDTEIYARIHGIYKDPNSDTFIAAGRANTSDAQFASIYKFDMNGTGLWGRVIGVAGTNDDKYNYLASIAYSSATQSFTLGGALSNQSKAVYTEQGRTSGFRYGFLITALSDASGLAFTSGSASPNAITVEANSALFPNNAVFPSVSVTREVISTSGKVATNYFTSLAALDIVYTNSDYAVTLNGPYAY